MFLTEKDYKMHIKGDQLQIVTQADDEIRRNAELASQEEMSSYLSGRYDVALLFIDVFPYDDSASYLTDEHIVYNEIIYKALQAANGQDPEAAASLYWSKTDDRNKQIVMYLIDITLFHLHSSINPRNIPELRRQRYNGDDPKETGGAIGWLKNVNKGMLNPNLPTYDDSTGTDLNNPIRFGSKPKMNNSY